MLNPTPVLNKSAAANLAEFSDLVTLYQSQMARLSLPVASPPQEALDAYQSISEERQLAAIAGMKLVTELYSESMNELIGTKDKAVVPVESEIALAIRAAKKRGLMLGDRGILDLIDQEDIIELYDARGIQFYRSWSFFKYVSYSLAELMIFDWDQLYIRPSWVVEQIYQYIDRIFRVKDKSVAINIPEYVITERFLSRSRSLLFNMKHACALVDVETGAPAGFVVTGAVKILPSVQVGENVELL